MAEPRFNNPYFWPPPPSIPGQLDNLMLINKIKEQLMAEKIRPPHLPPTSVPSQQPLLVPPTVTEGGQHNISTPKLQQMPGLHAHSTTQADIALHARPASSTVAGRILGDVNLNLDDKTAIKARGLWEDWHLRQIIDQPSRANHLSGLSLTSSRIANHNTPESVTPTTLTTPTTSSQTRQSGAPSPNLISGLSCGPGMDVIINSGGLAGLLGPPPKSIGRGRKKIKAENPSGPLFVVPYPILASGADQSTVSITAKEGKTYRCKVCPLTFFSKSDMQIHSKSHTEAKPHKCPHCTKSFANASYLSQHLRIHLGVKPYHCSYCEKSFRQLSHLQQHTSFVFLYSLQSHQRSHNKDKPYKCSNCYRTYSDSASLQTTNIPQRLKTGFAFCCSMCGRAYTSETYLMKHMSKHMVVEHLVSQHSPQRIDSASIPVRISLI
uniref:Zinc finger protein 362a n=1 Tax=Sinocyclocheilus rhinocerous TaxID=307959 RepID=A0A673M2T7_9TELE